MEPAQPRAARALRPHETAHGAPREQHRHAAHENVREHVAVGDVQDKLRQADDRHEPAQPRAEAPFLRRRQRECQREEKDEAREPREVGDVEDLRRFLPQQQMQCPVERAEREGRIKAGQQEPRPAARPVVFPQRGAEAAGRHKELYEVIPKLKHRRAPPRCPRPAPAHAGGRTAPSRTRRARRPAVPPEDSRGSRR